MNNQKFDITEDGDNLKVYNKAINDYIKSAQGNKEVCQILSAFITFEQDAGYHYALKCFKIKIANLLDRSKFLLGKPISISEASQPSNIIYENKHIKGLSMYFRMIPMMVLICLIVIYSFH